MRHTLFTATGCQRCKIAKRFMDEHKIAYEEVDIKGEGMDTFREFYGQNRRLIYRGKEGIEFPVYTDGTAVRQGVGRVIAYLQAGAKLDDFIGRSQLSKGWIDGLHISEGDPTMAGEFVALLTILKKSGLKLQLDTNGRNASVLDQLLTNGIGDRVIMDVKGPLALYHILIGEEVDEIEITKSIALATKFPEYEFQTTVAPIIRSKGETPEISYLTPEEIGETAKLIKDATGSLKNPYLLRLFDPDTCMDDRLKSIGELPVNTMFRYRTAAREHQVLAEIEKG
jgi:pyruvate formate lyase activating enzyme